MTVMNQNLKTAKVQFGEGCSFYRKTGRKRPLSRARRKRVFNIYHEFGNLQDARGLGTVTELFTYHYTLQKGSVPVLFIIL